jgi:hypothetical protein
MFILPEYIVKVEISSVDSHVNRGLTLINSSECFSANISCQFLNVTVRSALVITKQNGLPQNLTNCA